MYQLLIDIYTWFSTNLDLVAIFISLISLILTIINIIDKKLKERIKINIDVRNTYLPKNTVAMLDLVLTNYSNRQTVIQNISLNIDKGYIGTIHDAKQLFQNKTISPDIKETTYISNMPIVLPPLGATRVWIRFNFENPLPSLTDDLSSKIVLSCFGKNKQYLIELPAPLSREELFRNT